MRWVGAEQPRECVVEASEGQWGREVSIGFHRFPRRTLPLCQVGAFAIAGRAATLEAEGLEG